MRSYFNARVPEFLSRYMHFKKELADPSSDLSKVLKELNEKTAHIRSRYARSGKVEKFTAEIYFDYGGINPYKLPHLWIRLNTPDDLTFIREIQRFLKSFFVNTKFSNGEYGSFLYLNIDQGIPEIDPKHQQQYQQSSPERSPIDSHSELPYERKLQIQRQLGLHEENISYKTMLTNYRKMALRLHPDKEGGNAQEMKFLNSLKPKIQARKTRG